MNDDEALTPEQMSAVVFSAVNPEAVFRRQAARGLVRQFHKQFGDVGLVDLLVAIDNRERFASLIVLERNEVDNYMFSRYGTFDSDMMTKVQFTEVWEDFVHEVIHASGLAAAAAVDQVMAIERSSEAGDLQS
jgi:hypothetical protein